METKIEFLKNTDYFRDLDIKILPISLIKSKRIRQRDSKKGHLRVISKYYKTTNFLSYEYYKNICNF